MKRILMIFLLGVMLLSFVAAGVSELTVAFYDVGKADAMLITTPDGRHVLIDAATNKAGKTLADRFAREQVDTIDVMIITHFDKDHVGGADQVLEAVSVGQVLMPAYPKESKQYEQFIEALEQSAETRTTRMQAGESLNLQLGDVSVRVSAAEKTDYGEDEENDFSLAVRLSYGDTRFFFTGDAEEPRQLELLEEGDVSCDVLKVPYHGRLVGVSERFLTEARPQIAFITDSDEEPANPLVVKKLEDLGAQVYCAKDGGITVVSDGKTIRVRTKE